MRAPLLALLLLAGCPSTDDASEATCGSDEVVTSIPTSDGLTLAADYHAAAEAEEGAIVLLHMRPPENDRSGFGPIVRRTLRDVGWNVLNLDRRGAGGSDGAAEEAFQGEGGRLDVDAAVRFLVDAERVCAVDPERVVLIGASNGTTSALDYAVAHDPLLPRAAGHVWLSPGEYTENQHGVGEHLDSLGPMLLVYPSTELWSDVWRSSPPGGWEFERIGDQHGTHMFDEEPLRSDVLVEITGWLVGL